RHYDPKAFPEIVPVLVDIGLNDAKTGVRLEAVQSLGKLRPVSQQAGWALEQAVEKDSSMRVRLQARSLLIQYHLSGYRRSKNPDMPAPNGNHVKTEEPPLAVPPAEPPPALPVNPAVVPDRLVPSPQTPSPAGSKNLGARPLPVGPANPASVPGSSPAP